MSEFVLILYAVQTAIALFFMHGWSYERGYRQGMRDTKMALTGGYEP